MLAKCCGTSGRKELLCRPMAGAYFEVRKWSFCISKKGIGRFSGLEDGLQSDFRAIPSCLLDFSPGTMQFGDRSASGVNKWRPRPPKCWTTMLLLIALLDVASIGGTVWTSLEHDHRSPPPSQASRPQPESVLRTRDTSRTTSIVS